MCGINGFSFKDISLIKKMSELTPISDIRSDKNYREQATKVLIRQIVKDCILKSKKA